MAYGWGGAGEEALAGVAPHGPGAALSQGGQAAQSRSSLWHDGQELCFRGMVHPIQDLSVI